LFLLPWRKNKISAHKDTQDVTIKLDWLKQFMEISNKISYPDWDQIGNYVDVNYKSQDQHLLWSNIARNWLGLLSQNLPHEYTKIETDNFILISSEDHRYNKSLSVFLERCRKRLLSIAKGVCADEGFGKHVVIVFANIDTYYDYISYYGPQEGTYGLSSGMYLNYGYGHFVFQQGDMNMSEPIAAHEMTHALLAHLPIPLWLNEGMAVNMESMITSATPEMINKSAYKLHQDFWDREKIQQFWHGESFSRPDDGQKLSYQLAQILVTNLSKDYKAFVEFANKANWSDSGEIAMNEIYDLSLGDMVTNFLGEGDWCPDPDSWPDTNKPID